MPRATGRVSRMIHSDPLSVHAHRRLLVRVDGEGARRRGRTGAPLRLTPPARVSGLSLYDSWQYICSCPCFSTLTRIRPPAALTQLAVFEPRALCLITGSRPGFGCCPQAPAPITTRSSRAPSESARFAFACIIDSSLRLRPHCGRLNGLSFVALAGASGGLSPLALRQSRCHSHSRPGCPFAPAHGCLRC